MKTQLINTLLSLTLLLLLQQTSQAQANPDKPQLSLYYNYALPAGYMKTNLVNSGSAMGLGLDISWKIASKWRLGPSFGFQDFYEKSPRQILKPDPATDISAVVTNSIQTYPVLVKATFLPLADKENKLQPYFSFGAGGAMINNRQLWGAFDVINSVNFSLAFSGGAGVQYAVGQAGRTSLFAGAQYNYIPYNRFETPTLNSIGIQAGVRLRLKSNGGSRTSDYYQQMPNPRMFNRM